jgi:protein TonB
MAPPARTRETVKEAPAATPPPGSTGAAPRFVSLQLEGRPYRAAHATGSSLLSLVVHAVLLAAFVVVPLLSYDVLPRPAGPATRAFFAEPLDFAPPPPPPPPAPAVARRAAPRPAPPRAERPDRFVAPVEIPDNLPVPEASLDLGIGIEGGMPGGVEGGVPGGVVGGIVGGLPPEPLRPPPPPQVVRVGGQISAPALIHRVDPVYPDLARVARVQGTVILEARVDTRGRVKSVTVLRGIPMLDETALAAVRQWRYRPLLLNGVPTEFIVTVTVNFELRT